MYDTQSGSLITSFLNSNLLEMEYSSMADPEAGLEKISIAPSLAVYPNPGSARFVFPGLEKGSTLSIYTMQGAIIHQSNVEEFQKELELNGAPQGTYFYRVTVDGVTTQQGKFIKD